MPKIYKKITAFSIIAMLLTCSSCSGPTIWYQEKKMQNDVLKNRRQMYDEAYGKPDNRDFDIE